MNTHFIVCYGNPIDGLTFTGPFETRDSANEWADANIATEYDWWVAPIEQPKEN